MSFENSWSDDPCRPHRAHSDLVIGFLKTAFPDPDAGLSDHQRAVGRLVQRTLEDHLYWIALIYEFYDQKVRTGSSSMPSAE